MEVDAAESLRVMDLLSEGRSDRAELSAYRRLALDPGNPAFEHCAAQGFSNGDAHVLASVDDRLPSLGFLGCFEASKGTDPAELLEEALAWARARGARTAIAPLDLTILHRYRFAVGAEAGFPGEPANPPEYVEIFRRAGFSATARYASGVRRPPGIPPFVGDAPARSDAARVRELDPARLRDELLLIRDLSVRAFAGSSEAFVPFGSAEFLYWYEPMGSAANPRYVEVLEVGERAAGFCFSFVHGDRLVVKTLAVVPEHRGSRASAPLIASLHAKAIEDGLSCVLYALVREGNPVWNMRDPGVDIAARYVTMSRTC